MTREEFYKLTDILNSEVLGSFMHGGEADELIAMFEEAVDHSNILEREEPVSEKKCMLTKDSYTDEDRKVLCKDCDEKCEYSKKEESVDDDFLSLVDKEARELWKEINSGNDFSIVDSFNQFYGICMQVAESTVEWQKNPQEPEMAASLELDKPRKASWKDNAVRTIDRLISWMLYSMTFCFLFGVAGLDLSTREIIAYSLMLGLVVGSINDIEQVMMELFKKED